MAWETVHGVEIFPFSLLERTEPGKGQGGRR